MRNYLELMRVSHWLKNMLVLAPLFFSGELRVTGKLEPAILALLSMCLAASAVYIFNDIIDAEHDRLHPVKQKRPIARKTVSESTSKVILLVLLAISLFIGFTINREAGLLLILYFLINLFYSLGLKKLPIIDIFMVSLGFLIRILIGGVATGIHVSHWLVMMTMVLALFLVLGKRHDDLLLAEKTGTQLRQALSGYNLKFTSHAMTMLAGALFLLYYQYLEIAPAAERFKGKMPYVSGIMVLLGMLRYLQATFVTAKSGSPVKQLLTDHFLQAIILVWFCHYIYMLYF